MGLTAGLFVRRDNRFRVTVELEGRQVPAHLPNSGRLGELLVAGRPVVLAEAPGAHRQTQHDLAMVQDGGQWVSVDARLPNDLVAEALAEERLAPLAGYSQVRREVAYGRSRLDLRLEAAGRRACLVEVKSVTLLIAGLASFPDAVTARGRRHLLELAEARRDGYRAVVLFVVQRQDAAGFRPHDEADPAFGRVLRDVAQQGVEVYAYSCSVAPGQVALAQALPVFLD